MDSQENLTEIQLKVIKLNHFQVQNSQIKKQECSSKNKKGKFSISSV